MQLIPDFQICKIMSFSIYMIDTMRQHYQQCISVWAVAYFVVEPVQTTKLAAGLRSETSSDYARIILSSLFIRRK